MSNVKPGVEELLELERESYRRQVAKDFDWMKEHHTDDALIFPPFADSMLSQTLFDMANERKKGGDDTKFTFYWEPTAAYVSESEDMGYVHGITRNELESGEFEYGKYVSVWVKQNGKWKILGEIRNSNS